MTRLRRFLFAVLLFVSAFFAALPAFAQDTAPTVAYVAPPVPDVPIAVVLARIVTDVTLHKWLALAGTVLCTIIAAAASHKSGFTKWLAGGFFATNAGGVVWTFLLATVGSLATTWAAGQVTSKVTFLAALGIGIGSIGGYTGLRQLLNTTDGLGKVFPRIAAFFNAFGPVNPAAKV